MVHRTAVLLRAARERTRVLAIHRTLLIGAAARIPIEAKLLVRRRVLEKPSRLEIRIVRARLLLNPGLHVRLLQRTLLLLQRRGRLL